MRTIFNQYILINPKVQMRTGIKREQSWGGKTYGEPVMQLLERNHGEMHFSALPPSPLGKLDGRGNITGRRWALGPEAHLLEHQEISCDEKQMIYL